MKKNIGPCGRLVMQKDLTQGLCLIVTLSLNDLVFVTVLLWARKKVLQNCVLYLYEELMCFFSKPKTDQNKMTQSPCLSPPDLS